MNNKTLLFVFLALLGIYGLSQVFSGKKSRSFKAELITVDSAAVTSVMINPKGKSEEVTLRKEGKKWIVSNGAINVRAVPGEVNNLLTSLMLIKSNRIAAKNETKWADFEVGEGEGTRIRVYEDEELTYDFILGKFNFNQQNRSSTAYIRLNGEKEVYAIDGFQTLTMGRGFESYRNKILSKMNPEAVINSFRLQTPDTTFLIQKSANGWQLNNDQILDSMKVENYLNALRNLSGTTFADNFDETLAEEKQINQLRLEGERLDEQIIITAYQDTTRIMPYILHSSLNQEAWFSSDSSGVYQKIFPGLDHFVPLN